MPFLMNDMKSSGQPDNVFHAHTMSSKSSPSKAGSSSSSAKGIENIAIREWICPKCNCHHDRDMNSGINLKHYGERFIHESLACKTIA